MECNSCSQYLCSKDWYEVRNISIYLYPSRQKQYDRCWCYCCRRRSDKLVVNKWRFHFMHRGSFCAGRSLHIKQYQYVSSQRDIENWPIVDGDLSSRLRPYHSHCNHYWHHLIWWAALYLGGFNTCILILSCLIRWSKKISCAKFGPPGRTYSQY